MLDQLLGAAKDGVLKDLVGKLGLNAGQADSFLKQGLGLLEGGLKGGKLDAMSLLSGNVPAVLSKLDLGPLTQLVGGDAGKARSGMESILGPLMNNLKNNAGAKDLLGQLTGAGGGGMLGQAAGIAGRLFGKK